MLGFLQNMLGNVVRLERLITVMSDEETSTEAEWYYIGVIWQILLVFDPVSADLELWAKPDHMSGPFTIPIDEQLGRKLQEKPDYEKTGTELLLTGDGMLDFTM